jgi:hypothetical protein
MNLIVSTYSTRSGDPSPTPSTVRMAASKRENKKRAGRMGEWCSERALLLCDA